MKIFPAIDIYGGKAVRLYKGDYNQMTVYNDNPLAVALDFEKSGAKNIHIVDLEGAKSGRPENLEIIKEISSSTNLFIEVGGGIRTMDAVDTYLSSGVGRVILGTSAVTDEGFLLDCINKYGEKIAVGADVDNGYIAIKGWQEKSAYTLDAFFEKMQKIGVKTVICTDISKDGALKGTNLQLYKQLKEKYKINVIASGGVSGIEDIINLTSLGVYGAIIGKAYYTGAIKIEEAVERASDY